MLQSLTVLQTKSAIAPMYIAVISTVSCLPQTVLCKKHALQQFVLSFGTLCQGNGDVLCEQAWLARVTSMS